MAEGPLASRVLEFETNFAVGRGGVRLNRVSRSIQEGSVISDREGLRISAMLIKQGVPECQSTIFAQSSVSALLRKSNQRICYELFNLLAAQRSI